MGEREGGTEKYGPKHEFCLLFLLMYVCEGIPRRLYPPTTPVPGHGRVARAQLGWKGASRASQWVTVPSSARVRALVHALACGRGWWRRRRRWRGLGPRARTSGWARVRAGEPTPDARSR